MQSLGTLVVIIPTTEGVIIAADSRATAADNKDLYFDDIEKIKFIPGNNNLAFTITGFSKAHPPLPDTITDLSEWYNDNTLFDIKKIMGEFLSKHKATINDIDYLERLASVLIASMENYFTENHADINLFQGKDINKVILVNYDPEKKISVISTFVIEMQSQGGLFAKDISMVTIAQRDKRTMDLHGETDYFLQYIWNEQGKRFLKEDFHEVWSSLSFVDEVTEEKAIYLATSILEATTEASKIIPNPSGVSIGGPVHVYFINGKDSPKRVLTEK